MSGAMVFLSMLYRYGNRLYSFSISFFYFCFRVMMRGYLPSRENAAQLDNFPQLGHWVLFDNVNFCSPSVCWKRLLRHDTTSLSNHLYAASRASYSASGPRPSQCALRTWRRTCYQRTWPGLQWFVDSSLQHVVFLHFTYHRSSCSVQPHYRFQVKYALYVPTPISGRLWP